MMQQEFEKLLGGTVTINDYAIIEFVYTYHPCISDTEGKKQIVDLYKTGGMLVMQGMMDAARFARDIELEEKELLEKMNTLKERMTDIKDGRLDFEYCLADMKKYFDISDDAKVFNEYQKLFIEPKYSVAHIKRAKEMLGVK